MNVKEKRIYVDFLLGACSRGENGWSGKAWGRARWRVEDAGKTLLSVSCHWSTVSFLLCCSDVFIYPFIPDMIIKQ